MNEKELELAYKESLEEIQDIRRSLWPRRQTKKNRIIK